MITSEYNVTHWGGGVDLLAIWTTKKTASSELGKSHANTIEVLAMADIRRCGTGG